MVMSYRYLSILVILKYFLADDYDPNVEILLKNNLNSLIFTSISLFFDKCLLLKDAKSYH